MFLDASVVGVFRKATFRQPDLIAALSFSLHGAHLACC
jgi:hypothetical protein